MKVVVIGSSNIDMVAQVNHLPAPGETVGDASFMQSLGGKGANQAVAAARLGGSVTFITSLGNDMYAEILKKHFKKEGITTDYIIDDVNHLTGHVLAHFIKAEGEDNVQPEFPFLCLLVSGGNSQIILAWKSDARSAISAVMRLKSARSTSPTIVSGLLFGARSV